MDALGKAAMGLEFDSLSESKVPFIENYNTVFESINPLYFIFPVLETKNNPFRRRYHEALENLEAYFSQVLMARRKEIHDGLIIKDNADLLTLLILAETEGSFSDKEIRDNIMVFLIAGQDTTAFSLSASLYLLATNPDIQDNLRNELVSVLGDEPTIPTLEQLQKMPYLASCIKETLRLYPPVARLPARVCEEDILIEGHLIPKGTRVSIDTYRLHHDPQNWTYPEKFDPTRFSDSAFSLDPALSGFAWCPFGGYSRSCLGTSFSLLEQKVVLSILLLSYVISPREPNQPFNLSHNSLLMPKDLSLVFTPRR
ncbi:hypothetical protein DSO57_1010736 [Entomophthora muscae]|uniref:Uncharacterized protein n=1 Tax=Entomophthora muscae TaxID=34485 RepID=A0ACC2SVG7_9FUNG|nr:hypothetical protein DSO57_1010736 [Entomophthora muscae]